MADNDQRGAGPAPRVVLVDDDPLVLAVTRRLLQRSGYAVAPCEDARTALREVVQNKPFAVVADLHMPHLGGAELLRLCKQCSPGTHRVLYTGEAEVGQLSRELAPMVADAIVAKADGAQYLPAALDNLRKAEPGGGAQRAKAVALGMARALASNEVETLDHCLRMARCVRHVGAAMGLAERDLVDVEVAGMLHDVGMIVVPDSAIAQAGPLTESQWRHVHQHPALGAAMLSESEPLSGAREIVLHHHERFDGSGYPGKLAGDDIPLGARLLSVADAYEAITHSRPYAPARTDEEARAELEEHRGSQFDPSVLDAFLQLDPTDWTQPAGAPRKAQGGG